MRHELALVTRCKHNTHPHRCRVSVSLAVATIMPTARIRITSDIKIITSTHAALKNDRPLDNPHLREPLTQFTFVVYPLPLNMGASRNVKLVHKPVVSLEIHASVGNLNFSLCPSNNTNDHWLISDDLICVRVLKFLLTEHDTDSIAEIWRARRRRSIAALGSTTWKFHYYALSLLDYST